MELGQHDDDPYFPFLTPRIAAGLLLDYVKITEDILRVEEAPSFEGTDHERRALLAVEWMNKALRFARYCESRNWGDAVDCRDALIAIEEAIELVEDSRAVVDRPKLWRDYEAASLAAAQATTAALLYYESVDLQTDRDDSDEDEDV